MRAVAAAAVVGDKIETHCGFGKFIIFWENEGLAHNIRRNGWKYGFVSDLYVDL